MGQLTMSLYLHNIRERYQAASKQEKGKILDEFCATVNYHRKAAIRLLNTKPKPKKLVSRGRKKTYNPDEILEPLKNIWLAADQICGRRLKQVIVSWLPYYEKHFEKLSPAIEQQLLKMSAATIDRLLKPLRAQSKRRYCGTKPGSLLKTQIPIKTEQWDNDVPGFVESDTVAHCGDSMAGDFIWSLTLTDIATTWTENRAIWNKGATGTLEAIKSIEDILPFPLRGFDSDNGAEFLNYHLFRYFSDRKLQFTRSRPYKKNDNAHVEQKNWTHVRQLFGYERFDKPQLVTLMNDLYANEISLLRNYFTPNFKLVSKVRVKSKIIKKHSLPQTPYERTLSSPHVDEVQKQQLRETHKQLDPFTLAKVIQQKLELIYQLVNVKNRQKRKAI